MGFYERLGVTWVINVTSFRGLPLFDDRDKKVVAERLREKRS